MIHTFRLPATSDDVTSGRSDPRDVDSWCPLVVALLFQTLFGGSPAEARELLPGDPERSYGSRSDRPKRQPERSWASRSASLGLIALSGACTHAADRGRDASVSDAPTETAWADTVEQEDVAVVGDERSDLDPNTDTQSDAAEAPEILDAPTELHDAPTARLANRSAADYSDNVSGLVEWSTVGRWVADWERSRPPGVTGDLIVFQINPVASDFGFIAPTQGVRVYDGGRLAELTQRRSDGIVASVRSPARGVRIDTFLRDFSVSADRDMVLFVVGQPATELWTEVTTAWLVLRYWGVAHEHMAIANGPLELGAPEIERAGTAGLPPGRGEFRVTAVAGPNTALLADLQVVRVAVSGLSQLADTRTIDEYSGAALSRDSLDDSCRVGVPNCTTGYSGKVPGASRLPLDWVFDPDSQRMRSISQLDQALAGASLDSDEDIIVYDADASAASIVTFVLLAVVGAPARWYAPSFTSWGAMQASHPDASHRALPVDSPWRTDTLYDAVSPIELWCEPSACSRPLVIDPYAAASDRVQRDDRQYFVEAPPLPADGGGENPCSP